MTERNCMECQHYAFDMDDSYCSHKSALAITIFGRDFSAMHRDGLCTTSEAQLFEPRRITK